MKRLCLIIWAFGLMVTSPTTTALANVNGTLFVTADSKLTAYSYGDMRVLWTADIASICPYQPYVVLDSNKGVVVVPLQNETRAYDAASGIFLWTVAANPWLNTWGMTHDIHRQLYTDTVRYPYGPPRMGPDSAPVIALTQDGSTFGTTRLVDSRTGTVYWTRTDEPGGYPGTYASQFFPNSTGSYDVIFSSGPHFTTTGGNMFRVDGTTGTNVIWTRRFSNRSGIPVPDISGDGQYDFFASPSAWNSTVMMLNGADGTTVWEKAYGSFDVIGHPELVQGNDGYDVIVSAQGSSAGGVRRYRTSDGAVVWNCSSTYNNNTILGLLERADGLTILSGWRHQSKLVAFDASTGQVLWDSVPMHDSDLGAIGVPDLTGDGNQDVMALYNGWLRLYDGVTGTEQTWFSAIRADGVAYASVPTPTIQVAVDIKPGSYPNAVNLGSYGLIPVAILSSEAFDATTVDPNTVELAGADIAVRGKSNKFMAHEEDVDGDGLVDLVVQVATANLDPDSLQDGFAVLTGKTTDGQDIEGQDEITIVPDEN